MSNIQIKYIKTRIGDFVVGSFQDHLCMLDYRYRKMRATVDRRLASGLKAEFVEGDNALLQEAEQQIDEYLSGWRVEFNLPLLTIGSEFQKTVWEQLMQVRYGETASYQELAERVGRPDAVRAVAAANGANAMSLVIPCHRIIGKSGELVGYGGGLAVKKRLLNLEKMHSAPEDANKEADVPVLFT